MGVRSWRTARGLLRRTSTDLHHRASAFIAKRVQLGMLPSFRSRGPTLLTLWGHLQHRFTASSPAIRGDGSTMTIYSPPLIGLARISLTASPLQNRLWPWFDTDRLSRMIRWRIGWPRPRPESQVRCLPQLSVSS